MAYILLRQLALLILPLLLSACAKDIPVFTPPAQRTVAAQEQAWPDNQFLTLAYHDVDDAQGNQQFLAVRTDRLLTQLAWLRENGYQAVSVDQVLAAHRGEKPLPPKAVMLSFDDGYASFYQRIYPALKAYGWPAIFAPVGVWIDSPKNQAVDFGGLDVPRSHFTTWAQIREMSDAGLVEIASHTYQMHLGILGNPQGNEQPAATTLRYDNRTHTYETRAHYQQRFKQDAETMTRRITEATGKPPRVWIWPYGASHGVAIRILDKLGYDMTLTLNDGASGVQNLMSSPRMLISNDPSTAEFANAVQAMESRPAMRVMHVDMDYIYDPAPKQTDENLGALVQRVKDMAITHVFLQAYADPEGDGLVRSVYFPNRWLPMRADLFNRVAWQLQTRAGVKVFAWMPVLSFDMDASLPRVQQWNPDTGGTEINTEQYQRLSPFNAEVRRRIGELYEDLAWQAPVAGILFHDDALLNDFEDASPDALRAYHEAGLPDTMVALRADPQTMQRWTRFKSRYLIDFTQALADRVKKIRGPHIKTARNIFALPILQPESEAWFAQKLGDFIQAYDWTAPMAMPMMENVAANQSNAWLDRLVDAVAKHPQGLSRTVFELQAVDWRGNTPRDIDTRTLADWMRRLQRRGALSFGYYPDDYTRDHPKLKQIRPAISSDWYPLR